MCILWAGRSGWGGLGVLSHPPVTVAQTLGRAQREMFSSVLSACESLDFSPGFPRWLAVSKGRFPPLAPEEPQF